MTFPLRAALVVTVAYVLAAKLGFQFAFVAEQVTTVWAPTGIAMAALLLSERRLWPAVWLGAFIANSTANVPWWVAAAIAGGNTLEAVVAALLLAKVPGFDSTLQSVRSAVAFVVIGAGASPIVSATIGVGTLCAASVQAWPRFFELWTNWWLGDVLGALVVAPAILTLARRPTRWTRGEQIETALIVGGTVAAAHILFGSGAGLAIGGHPLEFVLFPIVVGAAVRLPPSSVALVILAASAVTIWHTARGTGPFAGADIPESLQLLQTFMGVLAGTGLLVSAAITERRTGERRRAAAHRVGEVLSRADSLEASGPEILKAICEALEWPFGGLWLVDPQIGQLRCLAVRHDASAPAVAFGHASQAREFRSGVGLPGRVWATGRAAWVEDVVRDSNFPRAAFASAAGFHGAFAFPIRLGADVIGVIECFNRTVRPLDKDLLETMSTVGNQIGQFVSRKRVERGMADEQRRTRAILDTAMDAIITMDHRGVVSEFNAAAERMFGYTAGDAIGRELANLIIPPALRNHHRAGLERYLAMGHGAFIDRRIETTGYHSDGHEFPVEIAITRVAADHPPRFTGFVRDLTARVAADREREQLLQRELEARRGAEAANRAKDEFLAMLSHELRTPLNAIVGWTRMLMDGTLDEADTKRALRIIDRNAHLQTQLVADILDVSRIVTGGLELDLAPVDIANVISAAVDAVRPAAAAKNIQLHSRVTGEPGVHEADPERLQQIIWNLLTNAVKFTPDGGSIEVTLASNGNGGARITVRDDGNGIDPALLPYVFERFWQADGSVSRRHGGLGLGLAIVQHLVKLHGGTVKAESQGSGTGSTFTVELPPSSSHPPALSRVHQLPAAAQEPHGAVGETKLRGCHALVVDDDKDSRDVIATLLRTAGATVRTASSAHEALALLDAARPDVLLADIGMPDVDGYQLIREVRKRDAGRPRPTAAVAVTAYAGAEDRARTLSAGFDSYVEKPISPAAVVETVQFLWRRHTR